MAANEITRADVDKLSDQVGLFVTEASSLREDVRTIEEKSQRDRKMMRIMLFLLVAKLVTLVLMGFVIVNLRHATELTQDCIVPNGACAQRQARQTAAVVVSITYYTERERLKTEIGVARSKEDFVAVAERERRLVEVEQLIKEQDAIAEAVRRGEPIPAPITTIPVPVPTSQIAPPSQVSVAAR